MTIKGIVNNKKNLKLFFKLTSLNTFINKKKILKKKLIIEIFFCKKLKFLFLLSLKVRKNAIKK